MILCKYFFYKGDEYIEKSVINIEKEDIELNAETKLKTKFHLLYVPLHDLTILSNYCSTSV